MGLRKSFQPKLKSYYEVGGVKKYCLTYILQVVHVKPEEVIERNWDPNPVMINVLCMSNGLLYSVYGDDIAKYPKSYHIEKGERIRPANFRYYYSEEPRFKVLRKFREIKDKYNYRIRVFFNRYYEEKVRRYKDMYLKPSIMTRIPHLSADIVTYF